MANIRRKKTTNWLLIRPCIRFIWTERVQIANIISLSMVFLKSYIYRYIEINSNGTIIELVYFWLFDISTVVLIRIQIPSHINASGFIRSKYSPYAPFNTQHQIIATVICYLCACFDCKLYIYTITYTFKLYQTTVAKVHKLTQLHANILLANIQTCWKIKSQKWQLKWVEMPCNYMNWKNNKFCSIFSTPQHTIFGLEFFFFFSFRRVFEWSDRAETSDLHICFKWFSIDWFWEKIFDQHFFGSECMALFNRILYKLVLNHHHYAMLVRKWNNRWVYMVNLIRVR